MPSDAVAIERLRIEAQAGAGLDYPNIAAVYDAGEASDGRFFIVISPLS